VRPIRHVAQIREYADEPVPDEVVAELLELARWTGSSRNRQPWHFIVVRDRDHLRQIAALRPNISWVAGAPAGIALVFDGTGNDYDEGRLAERLLTGATLLGLGGGVAFYGDDTHEASAKRLLGIPADKAAHEIVTIGHPRSKKDPRPTGPSRGRKTLAELVSYERWGQTKK